MLPWIDLPILERVIDWFPEESRKQTHHEHHDKHGDENKQPHLCHISDYVNLMLSV